LKISPTNSKSSPKNQLSPKIADISSRIDRIVSKAFESPKAKKIALVNRPLSPTKPDQRKPFNHTRRRTYPS
jgi:hypothetical protein